MIEAKSDEKPFLNPYVGGVGIGLTLFFSFFLVGKGLGASGALTRLFTFGLNQIAPSYTTSQVYFQKYVGGLNNPLYHWLVFMFVGIVIGALLAGMRQKRLATGMFKGPQTTTQRRIVTAFIGGLLVAFGARLAGGCTSGLALTGAAALGVAGWVFFLSIFAAGLIVAFFIRREWL